MAEEVGSVFYTIEVNDKDLIDALNKGKGKVRKFDNDLKKSSKSISKSFSTIKTSAVVAFGAIALGLAKSAKAASDLAEQTSKFGVTFADVMKDASKASEELVENYGLSTRESKEFLSTTGDLVKGLGFSEEATLQNSLALNKLAVDVTSFKNVQGGTEQTIRAFNSAILGEREALKSLGFSISENEVKNRLFQKGQEALTGSALRQAKALATIELITEKNVDAVGDFTRTQNQFANVSRRVTSRLEDMSAEVGAALLPSLQNLGNAFLAGSKDGGILARGIALITKAAGKAIQGISNLVDTLGIIRGQKERDELLKDGERILAQLQHLKRAGRENTLTFVQLTKQLDVITKKSLGMGGTVRGQIKRIESGYRDINKEADKLSKKAEKSSFDSLKLLDTRSKLSKEEIKIQTEAHERIARFGKDEIAILVDKEAERTKIIDEQLKKRQITEFQANTLRVINHQETEEKITEIKKTEQEKREDEEKKNLQKTIASIQSGIGAVTGLLGQFSSIIGQQLQISLGNIDAQLESTLAAIDEQTQFQLEQAGLLEQTREEKAEEDIQTLENQLTRTLSVRDRNRIKEQLAEKKDEQTRTAILVKAEKDKLAAQEAAEAERRELQREAAITQKQLALASTAINIPNAAFNAFTAMSQIPVVGPGLGIAAAAAATALGFKQLDLIRKTPLPKLQDGAIANPRSGGQEVIVAEADVQEAIIPLTEDVLSQLGAAIGGAGAGQDINLTVNVLDETFFTKIEAGVANRDIIIDSGGIGTI